MDILDCYAHLQISCTVYWVHNNIATLYGFHKENKIVLLGC